VQGQRSRLEELQRNLGSRSEQLAAREKELAETKLKTKLTFSDMTVLDKAVPPLAPAFPQPMKVMLTGIGGGLFLGLVLAMLAEALDRRIRFPIDLEYSTAGPFLGHLDAVRRPRRGRARIGAPSGGGALRPA
jgi:polysaccharide biosynthesis transport protein